MDGEECKTEILPDALVTRSWGWFIILQIPITMDFMHRTLCLFPRTAWNNITPVLPLTIGAVTGTMLIFTLSSYIAKNTNVCSTVLQAVGRETYIVVAFSQIIIMLLNQYCAFNAIVKYAILGVVLVVIKYLKDGINKMFKTKIL